MAETILFHFAELVLGQLGSAVIDEVKLVLGVKDELDRIKSNLSSIQAVLVDAEKQQITSESVKNWIGKLQDIMYDIDDLLDDIATEFRIGDMNNSQPRKQVRKFFSRTNTLVLRFQWAHQIKSLCEKLDRIAFERSSLVLSTDYAESLESSSRETYSKVNKSDLILGRDQDREDIIQSILDCRDCESLSVIPILGFGAIGKTTLAKLIYNDSRIAGNFDKKLWVYVSEKFNLKKVLKEVISMTTGENMLQLTMEQLSLEQLSIKATEALKDKKYFLVLDDLWIEDSNKWRRLRDMLDVGAKGSMVVVTTRDSKVASVVQTVNAYKLSELSHERCLEIFKRLAFKYDEKIDPTLLNLANKIVEESRGIPLLVTTLGNLLRGETNEKEWSRVIEKLEQGHEDILNVLKLSYDQLPSSFKLCFRIASIYGKGFEFVPSWNLLTLWRALGFLPQDDQGETLGRKCFKELWSKSLFTKIEDVVPDDDMLNVFCWHDFVYDLAKSMAGEELTIIDCSTQDVSKKARYIRLDEDDLSRMQCYQRLLNKVDKARLLKITTYSEGSLSKGFLKTIISTFKCIRVLDLSYCRFEELPKTIGYTKHLRYLDVSTNIRLKQLPNSICNLINLQTLNLMGCWDLQELPTEIERLKNLQLLGVTMQHELLPEGIGHLKNLRSLFLKSCPRLAFLPTSINKLENLDTLLIDDCKELDLEYESWSLECLKCLRILVINGLPKFQKLSMGVKGLPFTSLQYLNIWDCESLTELADWVKYFTYLKTLVIGNCPNLVELPHTLFFLDKLERLFIYDCTILSERCTPEIGVDWHLLSNIPHIKINGKVIKDDVKNF